MVVQLLIVFVAMYLLYTVVPNAINRKQTVKIPPHKLRALPSSSLSSEKRISLTFDDGPDARYTGEILDILEEHGGVKATFFLVATQVLKNPDLVKRMVKDGHEIGLHSYEHRSAWLSSPIYTLREFVKAKAVIDNYNTNLVWFRPPWGGTFNLLTAYSVRRLGMRPVLWSIEAFDWRNKSSENTIYDEIMGRVSDQDIIVLHDSGGAIDAPPLNTIAALGPLIRELKESYRFVTLEEGLKC